MASENRSGTNIVDFKDGLISALEEAERNYEMARNQLWFVRGQLDLFAKLHPDLFKGAFHPPVPSSIEKEA